MSQPSQLLKPPALRQGDSVRIVSLSSPVDEQRLSHGCEELLRLGYKPLLDMPAVLLRDGFFAGAPEQRFEGLCKALAEPDSRAVICSRGGYGAGYLLDMMDRIPRPPHPKIFAGYSDCTLLHAFLWRAFRWVTFYAPMVASGFDSGADAAKGYDRASLVRALTENKQGWTLDLCGESLAPGGAEGILLGGCLTLVQSLLATPWALDSAGAILVLEDLSMKPYQVDRALTHLRQAGQFRDVRAIILGDFPGCEPAAGGDSVREVAYRVLGGLGIPIVWGAAIGHTDRPMLTLPLGVRARLSAPADRGAQLEILEPACAGQ